MVENDEFIKNEKKQSQQICWNDDDDDDDKQKKNVKRMCFAYDFNSIVLCAKCKADERKMENYSSPINGIVQTFQLRSCVLCKDYFSVFSYVVGTSSALHNHIL